MQGREEPERPTDQLRQSAGIPPLNEFRRGVHKGQLAYLRVPSVTNPFDELRGLRSNNW